MTADVAGREVTADVEGRKVTAVVAGAAAVVTGIVDVDVTVTVVDDGFDGLLPQAEPSITTTTPATHQGLMRPENSLGLPLMADGRFTPRESYVLPGRWTVIDATTGLGVRRRSGSIHFFLTEAEAIGHADKLAAEQQRRAVCRACRHRTLAVEHVAGVCPKCTAAEKAEQEARV